MQRVHDGLLDLADSWRKARPIASGERITAAAHAAAIPGPAAATVLDQSPARVPHHTQLYLGEGTVKTDVAHILAKLQVRDRVQAVVVAYEGRHVRPGHNDDDQHRR